jgi:hypothetical protein
MSAMVACAALAAAGCSTSRQTVTIETTPPGATVAIGDQQVVSPASIELPTGSDYQVVANKDGYPIAQTEITHQIDWSKAWWQMALIPIGPMVGYTTGSIYSLKPATVRIDFNALMPKAIANRAPSRDRRAAAPPAASSTAAPDAGAQANWVEVPKKSK